MEVVEKVSDREKSIAQMETTVNKLLKNTESQIAKQQKNQGLKNKVREVDEEIKKILQDLDYKEYLFQVLEEKEKILASEFEASYQPTNGQQLTNGPMNRVLEQAEQDERESDLHIQKIMEDVAQYNVIQDQLDRDEKALTEHNSRMVEEIEKSQHGRDDDKEIEKFAKYQMELLKAQLAKEEEEEKK